MNEKDFKQTKKKFKSAYFLAKNEAPLSLFPKLIEPFHAKVPQN